MREHDHVARLEPRPNGLLEDRRLDFIGDEEQKDGASRRGIGNRKDVEAVLQRGLRVTIRPVAHDDFHTGVAQVERLRPPLTSVTDDTDAYVPKVGEGGVAVSEHAQAHRYSLVSECSRRHCR